MVTRGLGYKHDPFDPRDKPADLLLGSSATVRDSNTELERHVLTILDQRLTECCTGYSTAQAIRVCHSLAGVPVPRLASSGFLWWNGRKASRLGWERQNTGCYLRDVLGQARKVGYCTEEAWPEDLLLEEVQEGIMGYSQKPSLLAYEEAFKQRQEAERLNVVPAYYRVGSFGVQRCEQARSLIDDGRPLVFGAVVTKAFTELGRHDALPVPTGEELAGGHALCAVSYDQHGIKGPNSWGAAAGNDGWFHFSWEYFGSLYVQDVWALVAPPLFAL